MRCLAVQQPWAWALVGGFKDIENRSWSTDYRGPIVILASASKSRVNQIARIKELGSVPLEFSYGALVGVVELLDVEPISESLEKNPWAAGPYCWRVGNARNFAKPIPAKGKLKLFDLDADLEMKVRAALDTVAGRKPDAAADTWINALMHLDDERTRYTYLFDNYMATGDGRNALRLAEHASAQWADSETFTDRAFAKAQLLDFDGALSDANHAIELDPESARAYLMRSHIYEAFAERDEAKAIELNPNLSQEDEGPSDEET